MTASKSLFRVEALAHASVRTHGTILLARPLAHRVLVVLSATFATLLIAFFAAASFTRKAAINGLLLPSTGLIRVVPAQGGVVLERRVVDGQAVAAGDTLFVLASEHFTARGDAQRDVSALLQSRQDSLVGEQTHLRRQAGQRLDALRRRADDLLAERARIDAQLQLQQRRVELSAQALGRYTDLAAAAFVSSAQVQDRQGESLDQQQRLAELDRSRAAADRDLATVRADLADQQVQAERDQDAAARNVATIAQELTESEARRATLVRAPQAGIVAAITAEVGQTVAATQVLASLLPPEARLEAELYAPSRSAGFLRPGMDVALRYPAYPYQKFGLHHGTVREVSSTVLRPDEMAIPGAAALANGGGEPLYRVRVALDRQAVTTYGIDRALKSGMQVDASVLLERRRLYEWILEPLETLRGRV